MTSRNPREPTLHLGGADAELDQFLSDRLSEYNAAATEGVGPARELTVRALGPHASLRRSSQTGCRQTPEPVR